MPVRHFWSKVVSFGRPPVPSRLLHMKNLPSTIIITAAYLLREEAWLYLGNFLYLWCYIINSVLYSLNMGSQKRIKAAFSIEGEIYIEN